MIGDGDWRITRRPLNHGEALLMDSSTTLASLLTRRAFLGRARHAGYTNQWSPSWRPVDHARPVEFADGKYLHAAKRVR